MAGSIASGAGHGAETVLAERPSQHARLERQTDRRSQKLKPKNTMRACLLVC